MLILGILLGGFGVLALQVFVGLVLALQKRCQDRREQ